MRILIVEDEIDFAITLAHGLRQHAYAVDTAYDGEAALRLVAVNTYDLLILDLNLPDLDGLEICKRLRTQYPHLIILVLTARGEVHARIVGLDSGADDYLIKPFDFDELTARIRALFRRDSRARKPLLECNDLKLDPASKTVWQGRHCLELTRKEFAILEYLMRHPRDVISQEELLEHVWGNDSNPFSGTVKVHIHSLRRKLTTNDKASAYIKTIGIHGYKIDSSDNEGTFA